MQSENSSLLSQRLGGGGGGGGSEATCPEVMAQNRRLRTNTEEQMREMQSENSSLLSQRLGGGGGGVKIHSQFLEVVLLRDPLHYCCCQQLGTVDIAPDDGNNSDF